MSVSDVTMTAVNTNTLLKRGLRRSQTYYSFSKKSLRHRVSQLQSLVTQDGSFRMRHEVTRRTSVDLGLPTQKGIQTTRLCKTYIARTFLHINGQTEVPKPLRVRIGFCRYVVKVLSVILALYRDCGCLHKRHRRCLKHEPQGGNEPPVKFSIRINIFESRRLEATQLFQKYRSHLKFRGAGRVT